MKEVWDWKPLSEVCKTSSGGTPLSSRKDFYEDGTIPWLQSSEVAQGNITEAKKFITRTGFENSSAKFFPSNTVLIAMYGATAGQVGILRFEATTNQAVCGIFPSEDLLPEFLFYFFLSRQDQLVAQATGNAQPNISQQKIKNTEVPIPPLAEQQRIAALLDETSAALTTAKANAKQNLENARALLESHLASIFGQHGNDWKPLGQVCKTSSGGTPLSSRKDFYEGGTIPWLQSSEVAQGNITEAKKFITREGFENSSAKFFPINTVLIAMYGATAGQVGILRFEATTNQAVCGILPSEDLLPEFLFYFFLSRQDQLVAQATGNAQPNISQQKIKDTEVPIPSLSEQRRIVALLDSLRAETQNLTSIYERKVAALEALKASLLHQAFNGEL